MRASGLHGPIRMTTDDRTGTDAGTTDDVPTPDDLDHLRGDLLEHARPVQRRECPEDDCDGEEHHLFEQYPAVATTGAWGKYLNPVYRCTSCETAHTLLMHETDQDADQPRWGAYPPEVGEDEDDERDSGNSPPSSGESAGASNEIDVPEGPFSVGAGPFYREWDTWEEVPETFRKDFRREWESVGEERASFDVPDDLEETHDGLKFPCPVCAPEELHWQPTVWLGSGKCYECGTEFDVSVDVRWSE